MPSFLENLRLQNLFGIPNLVGSDLPSQGGFLGTIPPPPPRPTNPFEDTTFGPSTFSPTVESPGGAGIPNTSSAYDVNARMKELYNPTSDAGQQFENILNQYPQREKPGWLRSIAAMLTDYKYGPQAGRAVEEQPFRQKLEDWKMQIGPAQQAANLERQENVNARTLAYQQISMELRDKAQEAREKNDERTANIRQQRADIYAFKALHPNFKFIMTKGGNVQAVNPINPSETVDTGIPTGSLTELDKLNLQQEMKLEQISAGGEQARATEGVRQAGRENIAETRGWSVVNVEDPNNPGRTMAVKINAITGEVVPVKLGEKTIGPVSKPSTGGAGGKGELPTQTRIREFNAAREVMNSSPALSKWIHLGRPGTNDFTIDKPGKNYFGSATGPSVAEYNMIIKQIYGQAVPSHTSGSGALTEPPKAPVGWKYVSKPGGGWTAVEDKGERFE